LVRFATALGVAFQIQDDLLNIETGGGHYGKETAGDLWEGKHTLVLLHALRSATDAERARAVCALRKRRPRADEQQGSLADVALTLERLQRAKRISASAALELQRAIDAVGDAEPYRTTEDVAFLLALIRKYESAEHARSIARRHGLRARRCLEHASKSLGPSEHRDFLHALVGYVTERDR
jgi:geranylgeranyl diphosphate synthase type II